MGSNLPLNLRLHGLPKIGNIHVWPQDSRGIATVSIGLERDTRAGIEKWAKHLGVDVVEGEPCELAPGLWTQRIEAVHEADGVRTRIWVAIPVDAPAAQPSASDVAPEADR